MIRLCPVTFVQHWATTLLKQRPRPIEKISGGKKTMKQQWELSHQSRKHMDAWSYNIRSCSAYCLGIHTTGKKYKVLRFLESIMTGWSKSERLTSNMKRACYLKPSNRCMVRNSWNDKDLLKTDMNPLNWYINGDDQCLKWYSQVCTSIPLRLVVCINKVNHK